MIETSPSPRDRDRKEGIAGERLVFTFAVKFAVLILPQLLERRNGHRPRACSTNCQSSP